MAALKVWYDREGDYLEIVFEDVPAVLTEVEDDIFERRTPEGRVVGFAVMNFSQHDRDNLKLPLAITAIPAYQSLIKSTINWSSSAIRMPAPTTSTSRKITMRMAIASNPA